MGDFKIGFIGGGNMAKAISEGIVRKKLMTYNSMIVSGPHLEKLNEWQSKGACTTSSNGQVVESAEVIFIAVKPHILSHALGDVLKTVDLKKAANKLFVSVLAGVTLHSLEKSLSVFKDARIIRVMPNMPMLLGEGCTVFSLGCAATAEDEQLVNNIFQASGLCHMVPEAMINAVGALSGSGPAYIYTIIEAMSDGAVRMGVPRSLATQLAAQTVLGAAKMVLDTGKHPGELKDEVCSAGGSTIAGIHELERGSVRATFMNAIQAATLRSGELGEK